MRRGYHFSGGEFVPNLAPMVDVIMVLLVFFMLGASLNLVQEAALATDLDPRSGPGGGAAIEIIPTVKIALQETADPNGCNLFVMGEPLEGNDFAALERFLRERRAAGADTANPVIIGAQAKVRWQHVISAMDAAVRAGFANVQFAVTLRSDR